MTRTITFVISSVTVPIKNHKKINIRMIIVIMITLIVRMITFHHDSSNNDGNDDNDHNGDEHC